LKNKLEGRDSSCDDQNTLTAKRSEKFTLKQMFKDIKKIDEADFSDSGKDV
jgi:hypothetical protein